MPASRTFDAVTIIALEDGAGPFFQPRVEAFPEADATAWRAADAADPATARAGEWSLRFRCFAFRFDDGRIVLVDTGIGGAGAPAATWAPVPGRLPDELRAAGIVPADVDTVVLTHLHTDHIGWSVDTATSSPYFSNARYLMQADEIAALERMPPERAGWLLDPLRGTGQLVPVSGDLDLGGGLRVVATPGHTPGHQSVLWRTADQAVLVTGDLLVHVLQVLFPWIRYAHEVDPDRARRSRTDLLNELAALPAATLATAHLGEPFVALPPGGHPEWAGSPDRLPA